MRRFAHSLHASRVLRQHVCPCPVVAGFMIQLMDRFRSPWSFPALPLPNFFRENTDTCALLPSRTCKLLVPPTSASSANSEMRDRLRSLQTITNGGSSAWRTLDLSFKYSCLCYFVFHFRNICKFSLFFCTLSLLSRSFIALAWVSLDVFFLYCAPRYSLVTPLVEAIILVCTKSHAYR